MGGRADGRIEGPRVPDARRKRRHRMTGAPAFREPWETPLRRTTMTQNASGLTDRQLSTLRSKLEAERARLRGAKRLAGDAVEPDVGDEMDVAELVSENEEAAARTTRDSDRLSEIE